MDRLTIHEYNLQMKAEALKWVDHDYWVHKQAYLGFMVKASKGKHQTPVYRRFDQFFDYEGAVKKVENKKEDSRFKGIAKLIKKGE